MTRPSTKRLRPTSPKTRSKLTWSWLLFGWAGGHRFYLGHSAQGAVLLLLTLATCGVGGVVGFLDGLLCVFNKPKDAHGLPVGDGRARFLDDVEAHALPVGDSLLQLAFHLGVIFVMPFVVGVAAAAFFESSEVAQTSNALFLLSAAVLLPVLAVHVVGVALKTREQAKLLRANGSLSARTWLDAAAKSARILTGRGFLVLGTGIAFIVAALAYKWASLGVLAVLALSAFYVATGASALVSAFFVRRFTSNALGTGGTLHRRCAPGVVRVGDSASESIDIAAAPVPPGFFLLLEGEWPGRVATRVRHVVPPHTREQAITLTTPLLRTPRGAHEAPPLAVAFTDLLGLTKTTVASLATAKLKVLPAVRPAEIVQPPPSQDEKPDVVTRPHRFPTEDLFRFREYVPGDDTRRIHWKLSMKTGRLQVKKPDSKESTSKRVLLALDTHVPAGWLPHTTVLDDALDTLVESWLALAHKLVEDGEKVTLVVRTRNEDGSGSSTELIEVNHGNHAAQLDAGARAEWQADAPIEHVLAEVGQRTQEPREVGAYKLAGETFDSAIIVSMRLDTPALDRALLDVKETTWVYLHPRDALGPTPPSAFDLWLDFDGKRRSGLSAIARFLQLPYPAGSDDNDVQARLRHFNARLDDRTHRVELRRSVERAGDRALTALLHSEDAVYRVEPSNGRHKLRGLKGVTKKKQLAPSTSSIERAESLHDEPTSELPVVEQVGRVA